MNYVSLKQMAEGKVEGIQKTTQFQIDPRLLEVEEGFNARDIDDEHVLSIADAITAGVVLPAIDVRVDAGRVIVVDGHHRRQAYLYLINSGTDIRRVDCRQFRGNDVDRIAHLVTSAQGKPLTPLEMGMQYKKLIALNLTEKEIADKIGKSRQHVMDMLALARANADVHEQVKRGQVSAKVAMKIVKKHGDAAGEVIAGHIAAAAASGKKKVTEKIVEKKYRHVIVGTVLIDSGKGIKCVQLSDDCDISAGEYVYVIRKVVNN